MVASDELPSPRSFGKVRLDLAVGRVREAAYVIEGYSNCVAIVAHMVVLRPPTDPSDVEGRRAATQSLNDYHSFVHACCLHKRAWKTATLHASSVLGGRQGVFQ